MKEPLQKLLTSKFFFETTDSPAFRFHCDGVSSLLCGEQTNKKAKVRGKQGHKREGAKP